MSDILKRVLLKPGKEQSLMRKHPWIFSGALQKLPTGIEEGEMVDIFSSGGDYLASGYFQIGAIAIRILSFSPVGDWEAFWLEKMKSAFRLRQQLGLVSNSNTTVFRLVNAEGDGIPGLIVDYYKGVAVMQMHTVGVYRNREIILKSLREVLKGSLVAVFDKSSSTLPYKAKVEPQDGFVFGESESNLVMENGNQFLVDWAGGQKTGFFIDQRENRKLVETFSSGRKVLNTFSYTGGFSVYALRGGASLVHSVDSSSRAIELANENVRLNFGDEPRHESFTADVGSFLRQPPQNYDLIVLDPPAFAKHGNVLDNALQGYKRLNARAMEIIPPGGILFTFSCSQVVSRENFRKSVFAAAANAGRQVKILHQLSQPPDHPVSIYHPEGEYLKGLVLVVE